jgi:chromosome segregation ATPase
MVIDWGIVSTIIVAFAGSSVLTGVIVAFSTRKRVAAESNDKKADAAKKFEEAASGLVEQYRLDNKVVREQYDKLVDDMHECLMEMQTLKNRVNAFAERHARLLTVIENLVHQIKSYSKDPVCEVKEEDKKLCGWP